MRHAEISYDVYLSSIWDCGRQSPDLHPAYPKRKVLDGLFYDVLVFDEENDAHWPLALEAGERVHLIDLLYQPCPVLAVSFR